MSSSRWHIVERIARLQTDSLTASIDADNPAAGLRVETLCGRALAGAALFGVQIEPSLRPNEAAAAPMPQVDCFVRGNDFVAMYAETDDRPFRAQIYWRLIDSDVLRSQQFGNDRAEPIVALELIVSVQTSQLDSETGLSVCTVLGNVEAWHLLDAAEDRLASESNLPHRGTSVGVRSDAAIAPESHASDSPGCCLIRPAGSGPSYLEMVHPTDFRQTNFEWTAGAAPVVRLSNRLFAERLEKGVILRSRIRGLFVPRGHDIELARSEYRRFAASEPPLTT